MEDERKQRRRYRWSSEARALVKDYLKIKTETANSSPENKPNLRTLVNSLATPTGFPKESLHGMRRTSSSTSRSPSTVAISLSTGFALTKQKNRENVLGFSNRFRQGRNSFDFIILQKYF